MKLLLLSLLLSSCGAAEYSSEDLYKDVPTLQLPLKMSCLDFGRGRSEANKYFGKILTGELVLLFRSREERCWPELLVLDKRGRFIDTLELTNTFCYRGTDSEYNPWIEITKGLDIILTDTTIHQQLLASDDPSTPDIYEMESRSDTGYFYKRYRVERWGRVSGRKQK